MTNFERITQSPEELAKFLNEHTDTCSYCIISEFCYEHLELNCENTFLEWLRKDENNER